MFFLFFFILLFFFNIQVHSYNMSMCGFIALYKSLYKSIQSNYLLLLMLWRSIRICYVDDRLKDDRLASKNI